MTSSNPYESSRVIDAANLESPRKPWLFRWLVLGACGLGMSLTAFIYGAVMVGVPYQDPTPEMAQRQAFHLNVSKLGVAIGGCILLLAIISSLVTLVLRVATRRRV